jgi:cardiolipin synthase
MLGGCAALPVLHPDMQTRETRPVQFEGARGKLSPERSQVILASIKAQGPGDTGIFERHLAVEEAISGTPLVVGNRVTLLNDGQATYDAMFAAIAAAKDHINLETYIIEDDEVGRRFADVLIDKQRKGVQVNVIYDSVGCIGTPKEFFQRMQEAGIRVLEFNPVNPAAVKKGWEVNSRDHRKLLVADGQVAFVGGINISSVYSGGSVKSVQQSAYKKKRLNEDPDAAPAEREPPWRDTHLRVEGPVVAHFQRLFLDTWDKQKGEPLPPRKYFPPIPPRGRDVVRAIGSSPDEEYSLIYVTLVSAVRSAETSIYITNAYFVPDPQFLAALKEAAQRGVDVKLILPSKLDSNLVLAAGRSYYAELLEAGVKIYERRGALLHAKAVTIDGVWSTVGSTNLDWRSFLHNQEVNASVLGQEFGAQMRAMFERDLAEADEITLESWGKRGLGARFMEGVARMWEYWL